MHFRCQAWFCMPLITFYFNWNNHTTSTRPLGVKTTLVLINIFNLIGLSWNILQAWCECHTVMLTFFFFLAICVFFLTICVFQEHITHLHLTFFVQPTLRNDKNYTEVVNTTWPHRLRMGVPGLRICVYTVHYNLKGCTVMCEPFWCSTYCVGKVTRQCLYTTRFEGKGEPKLITLRSFHW